MTDLHDEITLSRDAQEVLNHPAYQKAWAELKDGLVAAMNASAMGDEKTHNRLVIALQIANKLQKILENAVSTGKMAEIQLEDRSKLKRILSKF